MRVVALLAALCIAAPLAAQHQEVGMPGMGSRSAITASAEGEARVTPDQAIISIGVETHGATAAQASADNAKRQRAVIDTIKKLGIPDAQISTVGYNVYPEQRYDPAKGDTAPRIVGYAVSNTVRVEVRRLDQLGSLIDASLSKGANSISSLDFKASKQDDARRAALVEAVQRARGDAEALARGAGGHLGELLELTSQTGSPPPRPMPVAFSMAAQVKTTPISPGEQTLTVGVVCRWTFVPDTKGMTEP